MFHEHTTEDEAVWSLTLACTIWTNKTKKELSLSSSDLISFLNCLYQRL